MELNKNFWERLSKIYSPTEIKVIKK